MTDREIWVAIRQRFSALRAEVRQRRAELIAETEVELLARYQARNKRFAELNRGLQDITDEANQKVVALLREFEDIAEGGRWNGGSRQAVFVVPRIYRVNGDRIQRHRTLMAEINRKTEHALRVLDRQQENLLQAPDRARSMMAKGTRHRHRPHTTGAAVGCRAPGGDGLMRQRFGGWTNPVW